MLQNQKFFVLSRTSAELVPVKNASAELGQPALLPSVPQKPLDGVEKHKPWLFLLVCPPNAQLTAAAYKLTHRLLNTPKPLAVPVNK